MNLTLGGIDLNNSGSVVVKADKKLLTVLFPDGRDGRAFTLKAETLEDLYEWKAALDEALAQSPSATLVVGQNGIFRNDQTDAFDGSVEQKKQPVKSLVIGRPILLALEDIDGTPSFLEKALRFVEVHGVKVEGILRQAADVDDVEHRIREYEQGKINFSPEEDAHVIADCVKYVLRELPSSPVPASCCNALLEACRTERSRRVAAMREAICETFPEPNRRLLQRILMMMQTVASHKAENRMSSSAVAACMAPLLLRPLLAGDCELEHDFDVGGDGSVQLLQAAAAANHAQAIVVTLLEEYESIFGEGSMATELYSDSEESGSESEELTDDDETIDDDGDEDESGTESLDADEDFEYPSNEIHSETDDIDDNDIIDKGSDGHSMGSQSNETNDDHKAYRKPSAVSPQYLSAQHTNVQSSEKFPNQSSNNSSIQANESSGVLGDDSAGMSLAHKLTHKTPSSHIEYSMISNGPAHGARRAAVWGRTPAKKNLSMESIDLPSEDEAEIERLEFTKNDLQNRIEEEAKGNAVLQAGLESRKHALQERRLALEQDVARLQEQLKKERELRAVLEGRLEMSQGSLSVSAGIDEKTKAELEEIAQVEADVINLKQTADNLGMQLNQQREHNYGLVHFSRNQPQQTNHQEKLRDKEKEVETPATLHIPEKSASKLDPVHNSKSAGVTTTSSSAETVLVRPALINSKKFGARGEGAAATSSAMSKLSNRLNFLKERRSQIANELQNLDKGRITGPSSIQNLDKFHRIDGQSVYNSEKGSGLDGSQFLQNAEKLRTLSDGRSPQNIDKGRLEDQFAPNLERGKSESFPKVEKGRRSRSEGHPLVPPRTYSR